MTTQHTTTTTFKLDLAPLLAIDTLSGAVAAIVDAGEWLDRDSYEPNSGTWHNPTLRAAHGKCAICDAGAVMAKLGVKPWQRANPFDFKNVRVKNVLDALDFIRLGAWRAAARRIGQDLLPEQLDFLNHLREPNNSSFMAGWGAWAVFDLHITDLRVRVLPALREHGL